MSFSLFDTMTRDSDISRLLSDWQGGDMQALERLSSLVYKELRHLAQRQVASESPGHSLRPNVLVDKALARIADGEVDDRERKHFLVVAARLMRRVLVDQAMSGRRVKREEGAAPVMLLEVDDSTGTGFAQLPVLQLDDALSKLAQSDPRMAESVELIYFGGLSIDATARIVEISPGTLYEDMRFAKAWLVNEMGE
ncbi:MAG: ECF-type sigma factor [Pseudomonadota bacterium]